MNTTRLLLIATSLSLFAADPPKGYDRANIDTNCKPCDDFWRYANGSWLDKNPIPDRFGRWGTMTVVSEANSERLRTILDAASKSTVPAERKIGDFYAACLDTALLDKLGAKPLQPDLDRIAAIKDIPTLGAALNRFQRSGAVAPFFFMAAQDMKNSTRMIPNVGEGGLSLPDRDYYFKEDAKSKQIREEFVKHVEKMLALLGDSPEKAAAGAKTVMSFETALAQVTMTNVQRRDPNARYHLMDFAGLTALAPDYDWKALYAEFSVPESAPVNVSSPDFIKTLNAQLKAVPLDDWKTWLRWRLVNSSAPYLSQPFFDQNFYFRSTVLNGVKEKLPRWQTCANTIDGQMGDALGQLFVAKYFPPEARQRMSVLIENLRATLREQLQNADWLNAETKKNAVDKLTAFVAKIGYPAKWRPYDKVVIGRDTYYQDVRSAAENNRAYQMSKIGKPIERNEMGMTPPTVNAYYSSTMNEIVFPAGILQPPLFDFTADDALNYGAIGAVIGHEMGHGFDDQGSKFDAQGNLKMWWTPEDRKKFEERAGCIVDQFNTMEVGDGLHHNGKLVLGEALGDLGGLTLAYKAYQRSLNGKPAPVIDGFTGDQRFFLAFARVWASQDRPESMRLRLNTDPHPLPKFRANGTLMNMPEFQKAFNCKQGDPMVRPADKQCKLW